MTTTLKRPTNKVFAGTGRDDDPPNLPVVTSTGRGANIMVPMAIPSFGGMRIEIITMLVVPVLYQACQELRFKARQRGTKAYMQTYDGLQRS